MPKGHSEFGKFIGYSNTRPLQGSIRNGDDFARNGLSAATAGVSAAQLQSDYGYNTDGIYWIDLPTVGATPVVCLMNSIWNGGGWMMAMKATQGTAFNYSSLHWTTATTLNPTDTTRKDADAKYNTMNYFAAKDMLAVFPDITTGTGGSITGTGSWTWLQNNFNGGSRITPINFFNTTVGTNNAAGGSGLFIQDAKTFSGWSSGIWSSQTDIRFYGFNYRGFQGTAPGGFVAAGNNRVRWGFGWNENGDGLFPSTAIAYNGSNDVSGGIGMDVDFGNFSAGEHWNCCNDSFGINRQARVEVYIR
jgi:hypothetical protein